MASGGISSSSVGPRSLTLKEDAMALDTDISYFNAHIDALREQAEVEGKRAVLIFDRRVRGFYDSVVEAANAGYEEFKGSLFLARAVAPEEHQPAIASLFTVS